MQDNDFQKEEKPAYPSNNNNNENSNQNDDGPKKFYKSKKSPISNEPLLDPKAPIVTENKPVTSNVTLKGWGE